MSIGLIALLDDVASLSRVAASSLDDIASQAARTGVKAAGIVIDDTAVTPRYVVGLAPSRELPVIFKITLGSLRNKLIFLLPIALLLSYFAPWAITPLLMLGGAYLSYEGAEKVLGALFHHQKHADGEAETATKDPAALEKQKVQSAIKTDFILSAEIMAMTLAMLPEGDVWTHAVVLALVAVMITVGVYGTVALIVKADDLGLALAGNDGQSMFASIGRGFGRGLVRTMPVLLKILSIVGTVAMLWVGGGIIVHGLEANGVPAPEHLIHVASEAAAAAVPMASGAVSWLVGAFCSGVIGLVLGAILIPISSYILAPLWNAVAGRKRAAA